MKKSKLSLKVIKVKSFITKLDSEQEFEVKGGSVIICATDRTADCTEERLCDPDTFVGFCQPSDQ